MITGKKGICHILHTLKKIPFSSQQIEVWMHAYIKNTIKACPKVARKTDDKTATKSELGMYA